MPGVCRGGVDLVLRGGDIPHVSQKAMGTARPGGSEKPLTPADALTRQQEIEHAIGATMTMVDTTRTDQDRRRKNQQ